MNLSQQQVIELKQQGFSDAEISGAINELETERKLPKVNNSQQTQSPLSTFYHTPSDNLVKWQLELNDILERAEHILREDVVVMKDNKMTWAENPNQERRIFNDYGVQEIMRILSMYINRNTILSDYEPDEIDNKVFDFGIELSNLIFMKYENFGLTTLEKRKNYPMLHIQIKDVVHSAYKRALYGAEKTSLREARSIQQSEQIMPPNINIATGEMKKERGILNPMRLIGGKYK